MIPEVGKFYHFWDDGKCGVSRHYIAKCEEIIPINTVVMATRIINPILDDANIIDEAYILDIYAKSKGDGKSE